MKVRISDVSHSVTGGLVAVAGASKAITRVLVGVVGATKNAEIFAPPMSVSVSPASVSGFRYGSGNCYTDTTTATPTGGSAPYTYAWVKTEGFGAAVAPSSSATSFVQYLTAEDSEYGVFQVTVTDAHGFTASASVYAYFTSFAGGL